MAYPGRRTRKIARLSKALLLLLLTLASFVVSIPFSLANAANDAGSRGPSDLAGKTGPRIPRSVGADPVPDLSLPKTILSSIDNLVGAGGIIRTSQDNLTIYNLAVSMRLLGGITPHDELLDSARRTISSYSFWIIQSETTGMWTPIASAANNFTFLGTNSSGTFLLRTMSVVQGSCIGTMRIVYRATPAGPLKWDLGFVPCSPGNYRFEYSLQNMTNVDSLPGASKEYLASFPSSKYKLSWNDVPPAFNTTSDVYPGNLRLFINLGHLDAGSSVEVDPSIVSTSTSSSATAFSFQRKAFYEPKGGYYFVFYYDGISVGYRSSHNGTVWSPMQQIPNGSYSDDASSAPTVYLVGQTVLEAKGGTGGYDQVCSTTPCAATIGVALVSYSVGIVSGPSISWQPDTNGQVVRYIFTNLTCSSSTLSCDMSWGTRYFSGTITSNGFPAFSYNFWAKGQNQGVCSSGSSGAENDVWVTWSGGTSIVGCGYSPTHPLGSTIMPSDSGSGVRVVFQTYENSSGRTNLSSWSSSGGPESGPGYMFGSSEFSASVDANYVTHVVYRGIPDGNVTYAYQGQQSWSYSPNIFPGQVMSPTISVDYSTGDLYAQAVEGQSIIMKRKPSGQNWSDQTPAFPVIGRVNPKNLTSNLALASYTNSSKLIAVWTEGKGPYNVTFASIPVQGIWSPYGLTSDPWDGNGLSPYAQYFSNLGEHVSLSTGMLVVRQTDLSVPGRGLGLDITRVYDEPQSFFTTSPVNYETYPWASLGNGWQLDFPWMSNATNPLYIHLWNGEGYRIPSGFWTPGLPGFFENHQGDSFRLLRNSTGVFLYTVSGIAYRFDSNNTHRLTMEIDPLGNNITFSYNVSNKISSIRDTLGRTFLFCYTGGLVSRIEQSSGSCGQETNFVRKVLFSYNGSTLNVTDSANRVTTYQYQGTSGSAQWILSRITYPTNWSTSYTYRTDTLGTQATTYRVARQLLSTSSGIPVRQFSYLFNPGSGGDQITGSSVQAFNSTNVLGTWQLQLSSYTNYTFSFAGVSWNVSDASHGFLRGVEQRLGVNGEQPREIILVSDGQGHLEGSYTNYYRHDLWGNQIYSRTSVNPSANSYHESFNAYYNNGLPPGFNAFQDTFSQNQGTATDNPWQTQDGSWMVQNGAYNGIGGSNQDTSLAWSNVGIGNMTLQASLNVASPLIFGDRVGIFVHYPGSGAYKWALVFHNRGGTMYLELLDDQVSWLGDSPSQPFAKTPCPLNYNIWYTLRLTIQLSSVSGQIVYAALGSVSTHGQQPCNGVMGNFSISSPVASATGFGLYAGGYSALFDNVTVSTDTFSPIFTGSFISGGAPGLSIHGALAGTAQHQNGTGSPSMESYYSYYSWGGLNQTKSLYTTQSGNQWLTTSRKYDSYGNPTTIIDAKGNSTTLSYSPQYMFSYLTSQSQILKPSSTAIIAQYSYNFTTGTMLSRVDPNGYNTTYSYDILGRVTKVTYPQGVYGYVSYAYNDVLNYVNVTNENGWLTREFYDGLGRLSMTQRFLSGRPYSNETNTYNWQNKITTSTDPLGNTYVYQYDSLGRTVKTTKPDGNVTRIFYNDTAAWIRYADETGKNFRCSYFDRLGRMISVVEYADQKCNALMLSNFFFVTGYYYDEVGNLRKSTVSDFNWLVNPGFEFGNFTGWTQTNLVLTSSSHSGSYAALISSYGAPFSMSQNLTAPILGSKITMLGFWYSSGDPNGHDSVQVLYSDGTFTQTTLSHVTSWTWESPSFDKTKQVRGIKVSRSVAVFVSFYLDDFVLRTSQSTLCSYDTLNRLTQTLYPDNTTESFSYDFNSNLVTKTDRNAIVTSRLYDSLNRLTNATYFGNTITKENYGYDKNGNLVSLASQNATLVYAYDPRSRVTCETYLLNGEPPSLASGPCGGGGGGSVAPGTMITMEDRSTVPVQNLKQGDRVLSYNVTISRFTVSTVTRMAVVQTNNMLIIRTQDPQDLRTDNATIQKLYVKKANGAIGWLSVTQLRIGDYLFKTLDQRWTMVTSIDYVPGSFTMYDVYTSAPYDYIANGYLDPPKIPVGAAGSTASGPSSSVSGGTVMAGYSFQYTYSGENMVQVTYNDNGAAYYGYDTLGRVQSLTFSSTSGITWFSYYPNDQLKGVQYGNGLTGNYTYNKLGEGSTITLKSDSTTLLSLSYLYNSTGTVASVTGWLRNMSNAQVNVSEKYAYDPLRRLTNSNVTSGAAKTVTSYSYDNVGNRLQQTMNGIATTCSYNVLNNELTNATASGVTTKYGYDGNGNLASRTAGTVQWTYTWNPAGNLLKVSNNTGTQGFYAYDGLGRRVESIEGPHPVFYGYLGTETLADLGWGPQNDYVYAAGLRIAHMNNAAGSTPTTFYYHADLLGSTRLVTDSNRNVVFSDNYQPYGQDNLSTGSETYKFTGKPFSAATGLYYDYQRWYDPSIGRFISRDVDPGDIVNPQSFNGYIYGLNSPLNYVDLDGATPVDTTALRVFVGFYRAITRSITVEWSFLSPRWWGDWYVGGSSSHTIWSAHRPDYPGIREEDVLIGKLDRPNLYSRDPSQRVFHFVSEDSHPAVPENFGKMNEAFFDYGSKASKVLLVAGLVLSAWNVGSAYKQGGIDSAFQVGLEEAGGWAGAWFGGEMGAAIGTALLPGVGTIIGGLAGAVVGGIFGQQGVDYLFSVAASASWNNYGIDPPRAQRGPI